MRASLPLTLTLVLLISFAAPTPSAMASTAPQTGSDWIVASNETVAGQDVSVTGNVSVEDGATLRLEGSRLRVGGQINVQPGGRLELAPSQGMPTLLSPLDPDTGFALVIDGYVESGGLPATVVEGLNGDGLATAVFGGGGFQIGGQANLSDIVIRNGTAGVTVREGGFAHLRNASIHDLGFIGVAALGGLHLEHSVVFGHAMGVSGRQTCDMRLTGSRIVSGGDNVLVYFCPVRIEHSLLEGSVASVTANGAALVDISNSTLRGYKTSGVSVKPSPAPGGGVGTPVVRLRDSVLEAGLRTRWGLELRGSESEVWNVTVRDHAHHGIEAAGGSLHLEASRIWNNGEYGLLAEGVRMTEIDNDYGSAAEGTENGQAPISKAIAFSAQAVRPDGSAVPGLTVEVFPAGQSEPIYSREDAQDASFEVRFETYETASDGTPAYQGPFSFRALHPERGKPMEGNVVEPGYALYVDLDSGLTRSSSGPGSAAAFWAVAAILALAFVWFATQRRSGRGR